MLKRRPMYFPLRMLLYVAVLTVLCFVLCQVDLNDIKVIKKLGGTIDETETINGLVFESSASHSAGGPARVEGAKIGLIQYCLSAPKTNVRTCYAHLSAVRCMLYAVSFPMMI